MLDFSHIQVVIMSGGDPPTEQLSKWLGVFAPGWRMGSKAKNLDVARNHNIRRFLEEDVPRGKTDFVGIDCDMVPLLSTKNVFLTDAFFAYCGYVGAQGHVGHHSMYQEKDFGCSCFKVNHKPLVTLQSDWFYTTWEKDIRMECECTWFQKRMAEIGFFPTMVGEIGHQCPGVLVPNPKAAAKWSLAWPSDLERETCSVVK
jgi:hypothetical protein